MSDALDRHEEELGAYVLGALEDREARVLEQHLEECPHCRAEEDRLRLAADALPRSVVQIEPPPSLKTSLMTEVYGETPRERRRLRDLLPDLGGFRPQLAWVSAAFLLAVGIACGWAVTQLADSDDPRVVSAQVDAGRVPSASASLVVPGDSDGGAILRLNGMPSLPADRVYQVWIQRGRELTPGTLFSVGEDGTASAAVRSLDEADAVMVTREAAGGARAPSEEPIVTVRL